MSIFFASSLGVTKGSNKIVFPFISTEKQECPKLVKSIIIFFTLDQIADNIGFDAGISPYCPNKLLPQKYISLNKYLFKQLIHSFKFSTTITASVIKWSKF